MGFQPGVTVICNPACRTPRHLPADYPRIMPRIGRNPVLLFLDFDGTIAPLRGDPDRITIHARIRKILGGLATQGGRRICIVSGRSVRELSSKVTFNAILCGNHGLEIRGQGLDFNAAVTAEHHGLLARLEGELRSGIQGYQGLRVVHRGGSLAVYCVGAKPWEMFWLKKNLAEAVHPYCLSGQLMVRKGRRIYEVIPVVGWGKRNAIEMIRAHSRFRGREVPIYIGDDGLDEEGFRAMGRSGISIRVGKTRSTLAEYYVNDQEELMAFLERLGKDEVVPVKAGCGSGKLRRPRPGRPRR